MELARILRVDDRELILGMEEVISMFSGSLGGYTPTYLIEELVRQRDDWIRAEGDMIPMGHTIPMLTPDGQPSMPTLPEAIQ